MPRFFIEKKDIFDKKIVITGEEVKHIKNVLRMQPGDELLLCDGEGVDYEVVIEAISKNEISTLINDSYLNKNESTLEVTLFQGLPKADKMEYIIQKCVELGIKKIIPVKNDRSVVKINPMDIDKKVARWQKISFEASKQSNRGIIPRIFEPVSFEEALKLSAESQLSFMPYENEKESTLKSVFIDKNIKTVSYFVGPEGGFSENEVELASKAAIKTVSLGPRILRTETAGLAVLSIIMYELGDVGE